MNLEAVQAQSRHAKLAYGLTDNDDNDPYGDGDQTPISASEPDTQHFLRQLWCDGGDLAEYIDMGGMSPFVQAVMECNVVTVRQMLQRGNVQDLLERRYCSLRLSALLVLVAWCKNQPALTIPMVSETASILLRYGARPDVKDYTGKASTKGNRMNISISHTLIDHCSLRTRCSCYTHHHGRGRHVHSGPAVGLPVGKKSAIARTV